MGDLCVQADIAQKMRVKATKPLAVPAARKGCRKGTADAGSQAGAVGQRKKSGFGP